MCGIFCHLKRNGPDNQQFSEIPLQGDQAEFLRQRGPDSLDYHSLNVGEYIIFFAASVLSLRSPFVRQPLVDSNFGSVLCWNGEAWKINDDRLSGNDSSVVFEKLLEACSVNSNPHTEVLRILSQIRGPYAFVFYDGSHQELYFGRDVLGRRSLLSRSNGKDSLTISSIGDNASHEGWTEVEADGTYVMSSLTSSEPGFSTNHFPLSYEGDFDRTALSLVGATLLLEQANETSMFLLPD
jgi:asparagine synthetase B (glutamine-hydrolysing)